MIPLSHVPQLPRSALSLSLPLFVHQNTSCSWKYSRVLCSAPALTQLHCHSLSFLPHVFNTPLAFLSPGPTQPQPSLACLSATCQLNCNHQKSTAALGICWLDWSDKYSKSLNLIASFSSLCNNLEEDGRAEMWPGILVPAHEICHFRP